MKVASSLDVERRFLTNTAVILPARLLSLVVSLLTVPVIVWKLGIGGFGAWEAALAFSSLSSLFFMPLGGTLLWKASVAFGAARDRESRRLVRLGVSATLLFLVVAAPAAWLARFELVRLFNIPQEMSEVGGWVLPGLVFFAALGGVNESLGAVLAGRQASGAVSSAQTTGMCVNYALVVIGLLGGLGFWSVLAGAAGGVLSNGLMLFVFMSRGSERPSLIPALPTRAEFQQLRGYFGLLAIGSASSGLREQTDKLVLAAVASPDWTAYYSIAFRLASLVLLVSNIVFVPVVAAAGALHAAGEEAGIKRLYAQTVAILVGGAGVVAVVVAATWDRIVMLWLGKSIPEVGSPLAWLMLGNISAVLLTGAGTSICRGIGRPGIETRYLIICLVLNAALKALLVPTVGAIGTVIATGVSWAAASALFLKMLNDATDLPRSAGRMAGGSLGCATIAIAMTRVTGDLAGFGSGRSGALASGAVLGSIALATYVGLLSLLRISPFPLIREAFRGRSPGRREGREAGGNES